MTGGQSTMGSQQIDWPTGWHRTPASERTRNNRFEASLRQSIDDVADELGRVGVDEWDLSTAAEHQITNPRYPYADSRPDDPGAVVRWSMDGEQYAVACDAYSRLRDNIRTLYLYIREKRKMEARPVQTGDSEFANARLLPAEERDESPSDHLDHVILGVPPNADSATVRDAFRRMVKTAHPDNGGSEEEFRRVWEAKEALIDGE